jgi:polysaccharide deacetylase family protein (PEP-CTERM system associated)
VTSAPALALTVDFEDSHHGLGVCKGSSNLEQDAEWILEQFERLGLRATFFVLSEVADSHPMLVRRIAAQHHEIAFHGPDHRYLHEYQPEEFARALEAALPRLEDCVGAKIRGFRAPYFSVVPQTRWCLDVLAAHGFDYDASIYPGPNDRYGWPGAPASPVRHAQTNLILFPVPLLHPRVPVAFSGGAYLRILPYWVVEWGFHRQERLGAPGMIYFHPWEISATLPWRHDATLRANITRHAFRPRLRPRLQQLLTSNAPCVGTMAAVIAGLGKLPSWNPAA